MTAYFDSSAVAKLLRPEAGGEIARATVADADARATSVISYPELCATMAAWDPRPEAPAGTVSFVSWDNDQREAAREEGLVLIPEDL